MTEAASRYRDLLLGLVIARDLAPGGHLAPEEESERVAVLDESWWQMTPEEQDEAETWTIPAPVGGAHEALGCVDTVVSADAPGVPRALAA